MTDTFIQPSQPSQSDKDSSLGRKPFGSQNARLGSPIKSLSRDHPALSAPSFLPTAQSAIPGIAKPLTQIPFTITKQPTEPLTLKSTSSLTLPPPPSTVAHLSSALKQQTQPNVPQKEQQHHAPPAVTSTPLAPTPSSAPAPAAASTTSAMLSRFGFSGATLSTPKGPSTSTPKIAARTSKQTPLSKQGLKTSAATPKHLPARGSATPRSSTVAKPLQSAAPSKPNTLPARASAKPGTTAAPTTLPPRLSAKPPLARPPSTSSSSSAPVGLPPKPSRVPGTVAAKEKVEDPSSRKRKIEEAELGCSETAPQSTHEAPSKIARTSLASSRIPSQNPFSTPIAAQRVMKQPTIACMLPPRHSINPLMPSKPKPPATPSLSQPFGPPSTPLNLPPPPVSFTPLASAKRPSHLPASRSALPRSQTTAYTPLTSSSSSVTGAKTATTTFPTSSFQTPSRPNYYTTPLPTKSTFALPSSQSVPTDAPKTPPPPQTQTENLGPNSAVTVQTPKSALKILRTPKSQKKVAIDAQSAQRGVSKTPNTPRARAFTPKSMAAAVAQIIAQRRERNGGAEFTSLPLPLPFTAAAGAENIVQQAPPASSTTEVANETPLKASTLFKTPLLRKFDTFSRLGSAAKSATTATAAATPFSFSSKRTAPVEFVYVGEGSKYLCSPFDDAEIVGLLDAKIDDVEDDCSGRVPGLVKTFEGMVEYFSSIDPALPSESIVRPSATKAKGYSTRSKSRAGPSHSIVTVKPSANFKKPVH